MKKNKQKTACNINSQSDNEIIRNRFLKTIGVPYIFIKNLAIDKVCKTIFLI